MTCATLYTYVAYASCGPCDQILLQRVVEEAKAKVTRRSATGTAIKWGGGGESRSTKQLQINDWLDQRRDEK